jgi:chitodextrinase
MIYQIMETNSNKTKVDVWNVINEVLDDNGKYRTNMKWNNIGWEPDQSGLTGTNQINTQHPAFIAKAFQYCRDKTDAKLELRDYENAHNYTSNKLKAFKQLILHLKAKGTPIDAIGIQGHHGCRMTTAWYDELQSNIQMYKSMGVEVYITEFDMSGGLCGLDQQKVEYNSFVTRAINGGASMIALWGVCDEMKPGDFGYGDFRLPFAGNTYAPKPAYYGLQSALISTSTGTPYYARITARGENLPSEGIANLYDNKLNTKWLDVSDVSWIQFAYPDSQKWNSYKIASGNLAANLSNDPKSWTLRASNDSLTWITLDTQTDQSFATRSNFYTYAFSNEVYYKYYILDITANKGGTSVEIGELQYFYNDTELPTVPKGLAFSANNVLSWTASTDNVGVSLYEVFNNGALIGTIAGNSYNLTNPLPNTAYNFTVRAKDAQGNYSAQSSVLAATTGNFVNFEAENANWSGGTIDTNHPGYKGTGFWANVGVVGNSLTFTVSSTNGGSTDVKCRFSSGDADKTMTLYVNGVKTGILIFPSTNGWSNWADKIHTITVNPGTNTIKYQYDAGNTGYINVDYIQISIGTGIGPVDKNNTLNIFPNPATNQITIENAALNSEVLIYSVDGKNVLQHKIENTGSVKINVSMLRKGFYLVTVLQKNNKTVKEIIIE